MKKSLFLVWVLVYVCNAVSQQPYSQQMVESLSLQTFHNNRHQTTLQRSDFSYVPGLVAKSILCTYALYEDKTSYFEAVKAYADRQLTGNAEQPIRIGDNDIDAINAGKVFFDLYTICLKNGDEQAAEQYKQAASYMYRKLKTQHTRIQPPLEGAGCFIHKGKYPDQMWLDGLYMGAAFLAGYEACFNGGGTAEAWDDIALQFKTIHKHTWDRKKQLNYHAWSANPNDANSFWANQTGPFKGCSKEFWGRGCGWYFAALADVLEVMPSNHPDYKTLLSIYRQVAKGLAKWQDESGCWFQLLQYDETVLADGIGDVSSDGKVYNKGKLPNYLESSASSMFTYAFCKGIRLGWLKEASYRPVAEKAYQGLLNCFITQNTDGSINIMQSCASAGLGPASSKGRTGTINYYLCGQDTPITFNEGKAIGAFTMASCEYERLNQ